MTALYWRVTLARIEAGDREVLWTYQRMIRMTRLLWQR
jgi:hypothetical protein